MRESTRKLNKILLDSLQNVGRKKHAFTRLYSLTYESKLKDSISRFMAMSLALLLLFSTIAGPIGSSIWSLANEHEDQIESQSEEIVEEPPEKEEPATPEQESTADTGEPDEKDPEEPDETEPKPSPDEDLPADNDPDNENTDPAQPCHCGLDPQSHDECDDPAEEPPVCICKVMCIVWICGGINEGCYYCECEDRKSVV